ncbi:hypothetical protein Tco_1368773 [Tanacetum coccineum]
MSSIGDSSTNLTVAEIKKTNRNPEIWANFDLCVMSDKSKRARYKKRGALFKRDSNSTLKNHMNKSCPTLKAATGSSQTTMGVDGSLWLYEAARVRDRMVKFVIQETFDHFDNKRTTSLIQDMLQPQYCHYGSTSSIIHIMHQEAGSSSHGFSASKQMYNLLRSENIKRARSNTPSSELGSGRVISPRRAKLTPVSVEVCICLKDHLDSMKQIQHISPLEGELEQVEEEIAMGIAGPIDEDEIANFNQDE